MMGRNKPPQPSLFYRFNLEQRVPAEHPLRQIAAEIDFDFILDEVEHLYGGVGNPSVPPPTVLKLMFLLALENVPSERALFAALPMRLDWLWFLGMDLDSEIPNHSVLSKARRRWGARAFRTFFERVVAQAQESGLVDGTRIFCDGSLFEANASRKSVETVQLVEFSGLSDELEKRLDGDGDSSQTSEWRVRTVRRSTTDPDAAVVTKPGAGPARPRYKSHRAIDDRHGVITATTVTPGDADESKYFETLIDQHETNTQTRVESACADTQYGTIENYLLSIDRGLVPRMPSLAAGTTARHADAGLFSRNAFRYDHDTDSYRCPAGQSLTRLQDRSDRVGAVRYRASSDVCQYCALREQCTRGASRSLTRHRRQDELDRIAADLQTDSARHDLRRRKHLMERSFAHATRFGFKRCRWRRLPNAQTHELLIATVQNIGILIRNARRNPAAHAHSATQPRLLLAPHSRALLRILFRTRAYPGVPVTNH